MNYLIYYEGKAFYTNWFDADNNFRDDMIVFDLLKRVYTDDGINWYTIEQDHL